MSQDRQLRICWHTSYDKGIIAAFIMGKGSISITSQGKHRGYTPRITINNTEIEIINLASKILIKAGVHYHFRSMFSPTQIGIKPIYRIDIKGIKTVLPLLETMRASFVGRKEKLNDIVIEFCRSRLEHMLKPYSMEELDMIKEIRKLNPRGRNIILKEDCQ